MEAVKLCLRPFRYILYNALDIIAFVSCLFAVAQVIAIDSVAPGVSHCAVTVRYENQLLVATPVLGRSDDAFIAIISPVMS